MKRKRIERIEPITIVFYILVILVSLICFLPFWLIVIGSLSSESDVVQFGYALWPRNFSWESYKMVFMIPTRIIQAYQV